MAGRRAILAGLASAALTPGLSWADIGAPQLLSAAMAPDGRFCLAAMRRDGTLVRTLPLPARGHAAAAHPRRAEAVQIARRPGRFALVIDAGTGRILHRLYAPVGRHFYGHGAYTEDGRLLLTTENDIDTGRGMIGLWDVSAGYRRMSEAPSGGIGPHEIVRLPSGGFALANGGIRTHPRTGRQKLNLATMQPNLAILDGEARILDVTPSPVAQNAIRHIAAGPGGAVLCGFQWQGDPFDAPPLLAIWKDGVFRPIALDPALHQRMKAYVGSVAWGTRGWSASAPRGNVIVTEHGAVSVPDGCGLAAGPDATLVTDGFGHVHALQNGALQHLAAHKLAFDNHLVAIA